MSGEEAREDARRLQVAHDEIARLRGRMEDLEAERAAAEEPAVGGEGAKKHR
jgi:hypothetical protein